MYIGVFVNRLYTHTMYIGVFVNRLYPGTIIGVFVNRLCTRSHALCILGCLLIGYIHALCIGPIGMFDNRLYTPTM